MLNEEKETSKKKQKRCNVTFRDNEAELELWEWIQEKGQVAGVSSFIKTELYKIMIVEKQGK